MSSVVSGASTSAGTGLGQGIDVNAFVTAALSGAQANITQVQNQQSAVNAQSTALAQITTDLQNLQSAIFTLGDPLGSLSSQSATSSNVNILNAVAASTATPGSHTVTVNSLATTSSYYTNAIATTLATGSFTVQVGSASPVTVNINSSDNTLDGLAFAINNLNAGVTASVVNDASGARLAIVSNTSGAPGDLTVAGNTSGLSFTKAVTGTNASLVADGIPISSTSNTVTGAINGLTLNLGSASPGSPVTISVSPDTTNATTAINAFVSAYNTAINDINTQFQVNSTTNTVGGPLNSDSSVQDAQGALLGAAAFAISGNNGVVNLASIGINLNDDGTLSVDQSTLSSALAANYPAVQNFLQNTRNGFVQNLNKTLSSLVDPGDGSLTLDARGLTATSQSLIQTISDLQASYNEQQQNLILVYSQVNTTLQELPLLQSQLSQQLSGAGIA